MKTNNFIIKSKLKHGNKYDYSLVKYENSHKKIDIICPEHGLFKQSPTNHLSGNNCPKCSNRNKTNEELIKEFKSIQGDRYDYSLVDYKNNKTKVKIICSEHGVFEQTPSNHLKANNCPKCLGRNMSLNEIINKLKIIHNNKYNYSLMNYDKKNDNIIIICNKHGEFEQRLSHHLYGSGCPKCVNKNVTNEEFINKSNEKHGDKYDYSLVEYKNSKTKVKIICPLHGEFKQTPSGHLCGKGCPLCKESKGEKQIRNYLIENNINFIPQHKFSDCKYKRELPFDFYLPDYNTCIEYQGEQHYKSVTIWGGEKSFSDIKNRDKIKMEYCKNNNIPLIIIKYDEDVNTKLTPIMSF